MSIRFRSSVLFLSLLTAGAGCAQPLDGVEPTGPRPSPARELDAGKDCDGSESWSDVEDTSATVQSLADAVGKLHISGGYVCSGAMIGPDLFLTAGHCADGADYVQFNYQVDDGSLPGSSEMPTFDVLEVVDSDDSTYDYAILRLDGDPGLTWGYLTFNARTPKVDEEITIIHHPSGDPKVVSTGTISTVYSVKLNYTADTLGGSSGSPVLDADGTIIAVHTFGACSGTTSMNGGYRSDVIYEASGALAGRLPLADGFANYEAGYADASAALSGGVVTLSGLVESLDGTWASNAVIGQLPEDLWPDAHLIANVNQNQYTGRVDIWPTGEVTWQAGDTTYGWVSLDGVSFEVDAGTTLTLASGVRSYGAGYRAPSYTSDGGRVKLSGLVEATRGAWASGDVITTLPADARPSARLIFNLNQHEDTARVDVYTDGRVVWVTGDSTRSWLSLDGIDFQVAVGTTMTLGSGFRSYGAGYRTPSYTVDGDLVQLSGLVRSSASTWTSGAVIGTLPAGARPVGRRIFNVNQNKQTGRVDILETGEITWYAGTTTYPWVSLDGVTFLIE